MQTGKSKTKTENTNKMKTNYSELKPIKPKQTYTFHFVAKNDLKIRKKSHNVSKKKKLVHKAKNDN